jgi:Bacteriophage abortive infection AbiH
VNDKLYIIGNGFDLHHKLKTAYSDFGSYLKGRDSKLHTILESYISFPDADNDLWYRFEENLANLDTDEILSENSDYLPNYASEEFKDRDRYAFPDTMENYFQHLTEGLFENFLDFIQQVDFPLTSEQLKLELDCDSAFLTFNYTNTLEKLYKIDRTNVLYLHNSAFYGPDQIVLGHGIDPKTFEQERPEPPDNIDPEDYSKWYEENDNYDYSYSTGKETLMKYFGATFKPTNEIILKNAIFFTSVNKFNEIIILGHSLSSVDLPYIKEIFKYTNSNVEWKVSFYNESESAKHLTTLTNIGIEKSKITLFELRNLQINNKQLKLEF